MPSSTSPSKTPPKLLGLRGRADLIGALAAGDLETARAIAELAELDWIPPPPKPDELDRDALSETLGKSASEDAPIAEIATQPSVPVLFWRVYSFEDAIPTSQSETETGVSGAGAYPGWVSRPRVAPSIPPLAEWRELEPRLRRLLCLLRRGRGPDLERAVEQLSRGQLMTRLPREQRRRWGPVLCLIEDRASRLAPYRQDQYLVYQALHALIPDTSLRRLVVHEGEDPALVLRAAAEDGEGLPPLGAQLLVLGDLGCLATEPSRHVETWRRLGTDLRAAGCSPVALFPAPIERCPRTLAEIWHLIPWERPRPRAPEDGLAARAMRLLCLVSPAVRIEPGLLRAARLLLPPSAADAGTESDVWQHHFLQSRSPAGATLNPSRTRQLRSAFADTLPPDLQLRFARLLRSWRGHLPEEIWFEELLNLPPTLRTHPDLAMDQSLARRYFAEFARQCDGALDRVSGADRDWLGRVERRAGPALWEDREVGEPLKVLSWRLHQDDPDFQPPFALDLARIAPSDAPPRRLQLWQRGNALRLANPTDADSTQEQHSLLTEISTRNGLISIEPIFDRVREFWETREPPSWSDAWGWDEYGAWVEFSIQDKGGRSVTQRMRWIEPGSFLMGSPEDEPERFDDEGPRHAVTIRDGFWLFDTACTQSLWEAVMGENPSHFKGPDRPVERVSWNDAQGFIEAINARLPGLALSLPSEAQWEYACRAGTRTPFSFGVNITPEQVNYNGDYPYAGGPKGLNRGETISVKALAPNDWGLHQMHGNVWEWVQDAWHGNYRGAPTDGSAWETADAGAHRVIRGGSWDFLARDCRCASRSRITPDDRFNFLGFRCARAQVREPGESEAERADLARPGPRSGSGRGGTDPARAAGQDPAVPRLLRLDQSASVKVELPDAPALEIRTDRETLLLQRCAKPAWASAMGRDRFGLWAEIGIEDGAGATVTQRLRWISPGRFLMGSPEGEPERFDDEGPLHPVTIGRGFWLFDTPCTQALWVALGLKNPSEFQDPARPVERVSWNDIQQQFLPALNERISGFVLPSEAQWEYACRAGAQTALYTGSIEILGVNHAPALDPIVWYGGNSGVDFDLENGDDSSGWTEQQYPNPRSGSHPVGKKKPNDWGLYDMLGNVHEWTQDVWHDSYEGAPADGSVWESPEPGASRVISGGSWYNLARSCRCASRVGFAPGYRARDLGFRCARAQA